MSIFCSQKTECKNTKSSNCWTPGINCNGNGLKSDCEQIKNRIGGYACNWGPLKSDLLIRIHHPGVQALEKTRKRSRESLKEKHSRQRPKSRTLPLIQRKSKRNRQLPKSRTSHHCPRPAHACSSGTTCKYKTVPCSNIQ